MRKLILEADGELMNFIGVNEFPPIRVVPLGFLLGWGFAATGLLFCVFFFFIVGGSNLGPLRTTGGTVHL